MSAPAKKTAKQIADQFISNLEAELSQSIPLMPRAFNRLIAKLLGLVFVVLFQWSEFVALQLFVRTASDKPITIGGITFTPLDWWGNQIGYTRNLGLRTEGTASATVLSSGGTLLAGSKLIDPNTQQLYLTVGDVAITTPTITLTVRSVNYATAATLYTGQLLSFVSAPTNLSKTATVATVTVQGADAEDTESWRQRQLDWWAARPQGGAYADYREWGEEVSGVENIYPYSGGTPGIPTSGPGQVDIYVEASETTDGIAPAALLTAVKDNINVDGTSGLATRRNINTFVNAASITRTAFDLTVSGLSVTDEATVKAAIEDAFDQYMQGRENFITGLSRLPRRDVVSDAECSGIAGRVVAAYGGTVDSVTTGAAVPAYVLVEGEKAKIGTVTWN